MCYCSCGGRRQNSNSDVWLIFKDLLEHQLQGFSRASSLKFKDPTQHSFIFIKGTSRSYKPLSVDWFAINLTFTMLLSLPPGLIFRGKMKVGLRHKRECVCHCTTETDTWSLPAGNNGTTWIIVETLHCKRKRLLLMEEAKKVNRERVIETEVKQKWTDGQSLDGELQCCVKICYPVDMHFLVFKQPHSFYLISKEQNLHTYSYNWQFILPFHHTEIWLCISDWDSHSCFLALDSSQAVSSSHVANVIST